MGWREGAAREEGCCSSRGRERAARGEPEGKVEGPGWTLDSLGSSLKGRGAEGRRLLEQGRLAAAIHSTPAWRRWKEGPAPKSLSPLASMSAVTQ